MSKREVCESLSEQTRGERTSEWANKHTNERVTSVTKERTNEQATDKRNVKTNQRIKKDARDQSKKETRT